MERVASEASSTKCNSKSSDLILYTYVYDYILGLVSSVGGFWEVYMKGRLAGWVTWLIQNNN